MRATTTPTYTPVPIVMERAARNKALREAMLASGKSPLFTALVVCKKKKKKHKENRVRNQCLQRHQEKRKLFKNNVWKIKRKTNKNEEWTH